MLKDAVQHARKLHDRNVQITTYDGGEGKVIIEGRLQDTRYQESHMLTGDVRPAGAIHDMTIRMQIAGPRLEIDNIEVEMDTVPRDECREIRDALRPVVGMSISRGFTRRIKEQFGGAAGCAHLVSLLLTMAPAAVQGYWAGVSSKPRKVSDYAEAAVDLLLDTCWVWRRDGPVVREYRDKLGLNDGER